MVFLSVLWDISINIGLMALQRSCIVDAIVTRCLPGALLCLSCRAGNVLINHYPDIRPILSCIFDIVELCCLVVA